MSCNVLHPNKYLFCKRRKGHKGMHRAVIQWGNLDEYKTEHNNKKDWLENHLTTKWDVNKVLKQETQNKCKHKWSYCYNARHPKKQCVKCKEVKFL